MKYPSITIYTDNLPDNVGGKTNAFVVRIKNKYRADGGIHAHENEHVRQWWCFFGLGIILAVIMAHTGWWPVPLISGFGLHSLLYLMLPSYKLWSEAKAYAQQVKFGCPLEVASGRLSRDYGLSITPQQAQDAILAA